MKIGLNPLDVTLHPIRSVSLRSNNGLIFHNLRDYGWFLPFGINEKDGLFSTALQ